MLGTTLERFFKAKSFGLHISKLKHVPGNTWPLAWLCLATPKRLSKEHPEKNSDPEGLMRLGVKHKKNKECQNENLQKLNILEGFSQNGLQIRIQRFFYVF